MHFLPPRAHTILDQCDNDDIAGSCARWVDGDTHRYPSPPSSFIVTHPAGANRSTVGPVPVPRRPHAPRPTKSHKERGLYVELCAPSHLSPHIRIPPSACHPTSSILNPIHDTAFALPISPNRRNFVDIQRNTFARLPP
jgi:hypothetical protein